MHARPRRSMLQRSRSSIPSYQNHHSYKWFLLIFICVWFTMATYFLYHPAIPFATQQKSIYCKQQLINDENKNKNHNNIIIQNICSFIHYLDIDTWIDRDCYFKHPAEGHGAFGWIVTIWYKLTKHQHCSTVNIHEFLTDSNINIMNEDKFTILINTWQRNDCLIQSVEHYLSCNDVAQIRIIWSDPDNDIPHYLNTLKMKLNDRNRLIFDEYKDNKLTNRFKYNKEWITNGIFQTDDDIMFSCNMISNTFKLWRLIPNYMIGFAPRDPWNDYKITNKINKNKQFYEWDNSFRNCQYSLLFETLGGFMHKKYYKLYNEDDINGIKNGWKQIRDSVNGNITAEDISMSMLYSYKSGYPPITVTVPESDMFIKDFLQCQKHKSFVMHSDSSKKRTNIFLDTLNVFGYYNDDNQFELTTSNLWVDVMPLSDQKCWAG